MASYRKRQVCLFYSAQKGPTGLCQVQYCHACLEKHIEKCERVSCCAVAFTLGTRSVLACNPELLDPLNPDLLDAFSSRKEGYKWPKTNLVPRLSLRALRNWRKVPCMHEHGGGSLGSMLI